MQRAKAFRFELRPNGAQRRLMRRFAGACRFAYNEALALQTTRLKAGQKRLGYVELCRLLTAWRNGSPTPSGKQAEWLRSAPTHPLQQALKNLDNAYRSFFEQRSDWPKFKKKGQRDSFRYPDSKQFRLDQSNARVFLPKLGWVRYRKSRVVAGSPKNVTVSLSGERWFMSVQAEREHEVLLHPCPTAVGIDLGVARFATLSDGTVYPPLDSFKRHQRRVAHYQRVLARRVKFSRNWHKARKRVQKIHARIAHCRNDYLHKASTHISKNHAIVCLEELPVRNMTRSAAGTIETPGRNVRAKSGLNRSILDQGWFEFRRQLRYELAWAGGTLVLVDPRNTSRTCPVCRHVAAENRRTRQRFCCMGCGFEEHADRVGAINILSRGLQELRDQGQDTVEASTGCESTARIACGATSPAREASAQEPAEETSHAAACA